MYFRAAKLSPGFDEKPQVLVDGGVWANCPALVGIAEAVNFLDVNIDDIDVLSVGTTYERFRVGKWRERGGLIPWNLGAFRLLMHAQQSGAVGTAKTLLKGRIVRIQLETEKGVGVGRHPRTDYQGARLLGSGGWR